MAGDPDDTLDPRGGAAAIGPARTVGGRYRVDGVLGRGGMGVVWAGWDQLLDRPVAVKEVVPPTAMDDSERADLRARTLREARAAARISADGVVAIYDVVEDAGRPWIVMERLPPRSLEDELSERGGLPPAEVAQIGTTLLAGLMAAHAAGVLHRDVKPSNVMFRERPDGRRAVLADFGIAHLDGDAILTATGLMMGSPAYIAPERARGEPATPASDLWSLGVTLWAAVEGRSPFQRANSLASLTAVITEEVPRPERAGPLAPVLDGLLRKDPAERIDAATARRLLAAALPATAAATERHGVERTRPLPLPTTGPAEAPGRETADAPPVAAVGDEPRAVPRAPAVGPALVPGLGDASAAAPPSWSPASLAEEERPAAPRRRRGPLLAAAAAAVVAVAAVGTALLGPIGDGAGEPGAAGADATAPATEPSSAPESAAPPGEEPDGDAGAGTPGAGAAGGAVGGAQETAPPPEDGSADPDGAAADPEASGSEGTGDQPAGARTTPPDAAAAPVPAGFERHVDPTGFSVAVPTGWRAEREGPRVYLRDPASRAYLLVDQTDDPAPDPVADWQQQEPSVAGRLENYARIGDIRAVDYRGWRAADWEFVFGPDQNTHVLNRNVVTGPDRAYALYWSVPSSQWEAMRPVHEQVVASFQPAG